MKKNWAFQSLVPVCLAISFFETVEATQVSSASLPTFVNYINLPPSKYSYDCIGDKTLAQLYTTLQNQQGFGFSATYTSFVGVTTLNDGLTKSLGTSTTQGVFDMSLSPSGLYITMDYEPIGSNLVVGSSTGITTVNANVPDPSSPVWGKLIGDQADKYDFAYAAPSDQLVVLWTNVNGPGGTITIYDAAGNATQTKNYPSLPYTNQKNIDCTAKVFAFPGQDTVQGTIYWGATNALPTTLNEGTVSALPSSVAISPDGLKLYVTYTTPQVSVFPISGAGTPDFSSGTTISAPVAADGELIFSPDAKQIYFKTNTGRLGVIDAEAFNYVGAATGMYTNLSTNPAALANNGEIYAVGEVAGQSKLLRFAFGVVPPTPTPGSSNFPAQAGEASNYFNNLNQTGELPSSSLAIYNFVQTLPATAQETAYQELAPQFKIVQFAEEKLDLLLHKEMQDELYRSKDHKQTFVIGGYDNLNQDAKNGYVGYKVNTFYQMLGTCFEREGMNWLFGAGVSESYMNVNPTSSDANYVTAWGSFGFAKLCKNWYGGFDSLFGYSMLNTHRNVSFLNETADSSHGLWNISFDGTLGYRVKRGKFCMKTYDIFGYIYGQENDYTETGIPGNNFFVKNEEISQIRNQLGIKVSKDFRLNYSGFIDAAYVYEYYINNNAYQAALVGTDVFQTFTQTIPTKNYGRVHAGFEGTHKKFVWRLAYTGLYGSNFQESSVSLKLGAKY